MLCEMNVITRSMLCERTEFAPQTTLRFKDPREAVLFAIHLDHSYFPLNEKECIRVHYGDYAPGFNSLTLIGDVLKNRRYVSIQDFSACWNRLSDAERYLGRGLQRIAREVTSNLKDVGIKPQELIVVFTEGEPFFDVMGGFVLREMGYIVFPEIAGLHNYLPLAGVPDDVAIKVGDFQNEFIKKGVIQHGAFLSEFELCPVFGRFSETKEVEECDSVAVEAKRAGAGGWAQLESYLSSGCFNKGYLVRPHSDHGLGDKKEALKLGSISWKSDGGKVINVPESDWGDLQRVNAALGMAKKNVLLSYLKTVHLDKLSRIHKSLSETVSDVAKGKMGIGGLIT